MTPDDKRCVVDTNRFVHSTVLGDIRHGESRDWLTTLQRRGTILCVTTQILREFLVVLTGGRFFERRFTVRDALAELEVLLPSLEVLDEPLGAAAILRDLVRRYDIQGHQIHDANIIAVMLYHGVSRLATYNRKHFDSFEEVMLETV